MSPLFVRAQVAFVPEEGDPGWRVRRHFDDVLRRLERRDISRLSAREQRARLRSLDRLRAYAERGAFPRNEDYPGLLVPHFIDRAGTTCAVAQLLIDSGHAAIAEHLAATQNLLAVDVMSAPGLDTWIAESGLSPAECAMVQPAYCCGSPQHLIFDQEDSGTPQDAGYERDGDDGNLGFGGSFASGSSAQSSGAGGAAPGGAGGAAGGHGNSGGAMGAGGAGSGGSGGHAAVEQRQGISAVALVSAWRPGAMSLQSSALASLSLGFLALVVRRNKLRRGE